MSDTAWASSPMPSPARPPFAVFPHFTTVDDQVSQLIMRTSNVLERLRGATPDAPTAVKSNSGSIRDMGEQIEDKLHVLSNNIAAIDSFI